MKNAIFDSESKGADDTLNLNARLQVFLPIAIVLVLTLATTATTTYIAGGYLQKAMKQELQTRATELARDVDYRLRTYKAALETIAESHSLRQNLDVSIVEWEARRVGSLFDGWFVLSRDGDIMEILMSTASAEGNLPAAEPRTNYPEVMRAEAESLKTDAPIVSDAFKGRIRGELVVTIVKSIEMPSQSKGFVYFSFSLDNINAWLAESFLKDAEFAAIADGSRRVIARSQSSEEFQLAILPEWYISFSNGRDIGVAVGPPAYEGEKRIFAMQRLEAAPNWTLALSSPYLTRASAIHLSPLPGILGLVVLILSSGVAVLSFAYRQDQIRAASRETLLAEVRAADARKSKLMAVLAHDLRTPLIALLGALDSLRCSRSQSDREHILNSLVKEGHFMLNLIDDVLELARLGTGDVRLRPESFSPRRLLEDISYLIQQSADSRMTSVCVQIDELPTLKGDVASLRRVLLNFATNAIKATSGGTVRLSAKLAGSGPKGHNVIFAVTDTGCGIASEDIPRLFRDFGMLERDSATADGTGLGLAICRRLASAMGGEVGVESTLGQGSRFWLSVTLPEANTSAPDQDNNAHDISAILGGLRVLVVEDHGLIRQLTCANLARAGMLTKEAADGETAVALAEAEKFDLILMDRELPGLDGTEAAARIRRGNGASAKAQIICVTAHQSPEVGLLLSDMEFDACAPKPLELSQLAAFVQSVNTRSIKTPHTNSLDCENLAQLKEILGEEGLTQTLTSFADEIETAQTELRDLIAHGDTLGAGRLVHKLAGLGDCLGAQSLSDKLRKFEDLTQNGAIEALDDALNSVEEIMGKTQVQAHHIIAETGRQCHTGPIKYQTSGHRHRHRLQQKV